MPESPTILLVDDEDSIQKLLTYPLERDGYRVVQARDGEEALELFAGEEVDLLVGESAQCLLAVPRLDHAEAVALERVREQLLNRVLVVDEEDRGDVGHRGGHSRGRVGCLPGLL